MVVLNGHYPMDVSVCEWKLHGKVQDFQVDSLGVSMCKILVRLSVRMIMLQLIQIVIPCLPSVVWVNGSLQLICPIEIVSQNRTTHPYRVVLIQGMRRNFLLD